MYDVIHVRRQLIKGVSPEERPRGGRHLLEASPLDRPLLSLPNFRILPRTLTLLSACIAVYISLGSLYKRMRERGRKGYYAGSRMRYRRVWTPDYVYIRVYL